MKFSKIGMPPTLGADGSNPFGRTTAKPIPENGDRLYRLKLLPTARTQSVCFLKNIVTIETYVAATAGLLICFIYYMFGRALPLRFFK